MYDDVSFEDRFDDLKQRGDELRALSERLHDRRTNDVYTSEYGGDLAFDAAGTGEGAQAAIDAFDEEGAEMEATAFAAIRRIEVADSPTPDMLDGLEEALDVWERHLRADE